MSEKCFFEDENNMDARLIYLLTLPELPEELRNDILAAEDELDLQGKVSTETQAVIDDCCHKYHDLLVELVNKDQQGKSHNTESNYSVN